MRNEWNNSALRLMELAERNPSLGGRELLQEIIERGPAPEEIERPRPSDLRAALRLTSLDAPDYRTRAEQADWIGRESKLMRDLYERGAEVKGDVLVIPAEEHELPEDRETPFITTLSYALGKIKNPEKAAEFHSLAKRIGGETADARTEIVVFKTYYDRLARDERGNQIHESERARVLSQTLSEMWRVAAEMERLETRESIEVASAKDSRDEERGVVFSATSRKVRLDEETLRFPAGMIYKVKERLLVVTIPEIDRRLERGISRAMLAAAIAGSAHRGDGENGQGLSEQERAERLEITGFLTHYIDERLRDPETRALNSSVEFRQARAEFIAAKTPEELGRVAENFLRQNQQRSEDLRRHFADPNHRSRPATEPLDARQRNLLFNGRAPEHHTREMRELRINYGLSRAQRAERTEQLHRGLLEPSDALQQILGELESRRTTKAIAHFQASLLNEQMNQEGRLNLHQLYNLIPPHERTYLFEITESRKRAFQKTHGLDQQKQEHLSQPKRAFGAMPRESQSLREYLMNMGRIERRLLNEEVGRLRLNVVAKEDRNGLTITEARSLLPAETAREIRTRARNLAWEQIAPTESFERNPSPEAIRISDTIAHIQEDLQEKARLAQNARNEFVAGMVRDAERRKTNVDLANREDREKFVQSVIANLPSEDASRLATLDRYAAETREAVYQGFEAIDIERRTLELSRTQSKDRPAEGVDALRTIEAPLPNGQLYFLPPDQVEPRKPAHGLASAERRDRTDDFPRDRSVTNFQPGYVGDDREWHFDSLRDVRLIMRFNGDDTTDRYGMQLNDREDQDRTIDR
ncbi:MAG: hypothetical protein MOB07_10790 [Acidobacteria bacterium]|nr:hypothetical protein [Acidobacteriota bacterium]